MRGSKKRDGKEKGGEKDGSGGKGDGCSLLA